jgi:hypothetical protein
MGAAGELAGLMETAHLLRSPRNARRLVTALHRAERRQGRATSVERLRREIGPEALQYVLAGCWSRRITQEHRLVYQVGETRVDFLQARYHY